LGTRKAPSPARWREKKGRSRLAAGGTILLDEIGEMPMLLQAKLLESCRSGKSIARRQEPVPVDVRVIANDHRDWRPNARRDGREDLYYRLNVFPLRVPPLRNAGGHTPSRKTFISWRLFFRRGPARTSAVAPRKRDSLPADHRRGEA